MSESVAVRSRFDIWRTIVTILVLLQQNFLALLLVFAVDQIVCTVLSAASDAVTAGVGQNFHRLVGFVDSLLETMVEVLFGAAAVSVLIGQLAGHRLAWRAAFQNAFAALPALVVINVMAAIGIGLASLLLIVPGLMLIVRWAVVGSVRIVEGPGMERAFRRSAYLTHGHRWRLFGLFVMLGAAVGCVMGLAIVLAGGSDNFATLLASKSMVLQLLYPAASVVLGAGTAAWGASIYHELVRISDDPADHPPVSEGNPWFVGFDA